MKNTIGCLVLFVALISLPTHAIGPQTSRDIVDSVLYDCEPKYIEKEVTTFVQRFISALKDKGVVSCEQNFAAFIATMGILDELQLKVQELAPVKPEATNLWSGRPRTAWFHASERSFQALSDRAYFASISAKRAVSALVESSLIACWQQKLEAAHSEYLISSGFMKSDEQRQLLFHRLVELEALFFMQDHARKLFEAAYAAAIQDLGEDANYHPFRTQKSWSFFRKNYFSGMTASETAFLFVLLDVFEVRVK